MAKIIRFFLVIDDKKEEQEKALLAIQENSLPQNGASYFGSYESRDMWWMHENDTLGNLNVVWLAKNMCGFREILALVKSQVSLGVVRREDVLIVTDLMFPNAEGGRDIPNGISVITEAIKEDFVVALCSDTNHHEAQFFQDLYQMLSEKAAYNIPYCMDKKDWKKMLLEGLKIVKEIKDLCL